jgi:hypothetical protein
LKGAKFTSTKLSESMRNGNCRATLASMTQAGLIN